MLLEWTNEVEDSRIEGWMISDRGALHSSPRLYGMFAILVCRSQSEARRIHECPYGGNRALESDHWAKLKPAPSHPRHCQSVAAPSPGPAPTGCTQDGACSRVA